MFGRTSVKLELNFKCRYRRLAKKKYPAACRYLHILGPKSLYLRE